MDLSWKERYETPNDYQVPRLSMGTCTHCKKENVAGLSIQMIDPNVGHICNDCVKKLLK